MAERFYNFYMESCWWRGLPCAVVSLSITFGLSTKNTRGDGYQALPQSWDAYCQCKHAMQVAAGDGESIHAADSLGCREDEVAVAMYGIKLSV
jgi:hypothetical protein